jgi:CBS-domain-containing membrane protein
MPRSAIRTRYRRDAADRSLRALEPGGHRLHPWLAASVAVATAIALMHATRTLHPPGGATALVAVVRSPDVHALGFLYVLVPGTVAPLVLLAVALVVNNIPRFRRYPEYWL